MPLKHVRVCVPCDVVRYGQCSVGCRVPDEGDPASWVVVEDDAETLSREPKSSTSSTRKGLAAEASDVGGVDDVIKRRGA